MSRLVVVLWLTAVWVTLWESVSAANLLGGVAVAGVVVYLLPPRTPVSRVGFRPFAAIRLILYFLWELILASAEVAWEVATPRNRIRPAVVSVQLDTDVPGIITAVANMVSLTPGTITLEVDEDNRTLFIHVLHLKTVEDTRTSVRRLEEVTSRAFPGISRVGSADRKEKPT